MKKLNILYLIIGLFAFAACEKIVDLEIPSGDPVLVVESQITNKKDLWRVRLSLSQPYFDQSTIEGIASAVVVISGTDGSNETLVYTDTGMFVSQDSMECLVGETYTLSINYKGEIYEASEVLANGFPIDTIASYNLPDNNGFIEAGIYVFIQGKENEYKGDSYLWKFYKNDTLQETFGSLLEDDEFGMVSYLNQSIDVNDLLGGIARGIIPRPYPFRVDVGDTIRVEQYNLSPQYYQFIIDVEAQLNRSGSPFDPPPANPNDNISNGGIGYFSVAHFTEARLIIPQL